MDVFEKWAEIEELWNKQKLDTVFRPLATQERVIETYFVVSDSQSDSKTEFDCYA